MLQDTTFNIGATVDNDDFGLYSPLKVNQPAFYDIKNWAGGKISYCDRTKRLVQVAQAVSKDPADTAIRIQ
jgi:hypothetical protein